jgi:threonine dehydrogenase-like Zn-dependent dehydrogenase
MKIAMLHGPRDLRIEEQDLDTTLRPDEIHVKTEISAFKIGTDRGNYEGAENVPGAPDYPRWVGDSNLGVVRAVGSEVAHLQPGDRVVSQAPHQSECVVKPGMFPVKVPDGVDSEDAVWAHLYTLSAHCYRKALFTPGENVAVVGLGVLGLGAVALGPFFGANVIGLGNHPGRLEMATRVGANHVLLSGRTGASPSSPCPDAASPTSTSIPCRWSGSTARGSPSSPCRGRAGISFRPRALTGSTTCVAVSTRCR